MLTKREKRCLQFVSSLLEIEEFSIYISKGTEENGNKGRLVFKVEDHQHANLGDIENDEFRTLGDIIDRMDAYHNDYIYETLDNFSDERNEYAVYLESDRVAKTLLSITPEKIEEDVLEEYFISFR